MSDRAKVAYAAFRGGFKEPNPVPEWDQAPAWVRDAVLVAYLQGTLDAPKSTVPASTIWTEFVGHCEAIEADADGGLLRAGDEKERQFCRGQAWAAKSIRRAVTHPKYRNAS